jgi:hypothetical protein
MRSVVLVAIRGGEGDAVGDRWMIVKPELDERPALWGVEILLAEALKAARGGGTGVGDDALYGL